MRDWREAGVSVHWKVYARNKKSITLDLKAPDAPGIILDLAAHFDVLIESFRFRYLERLGVGPDVCSSAIRSSSWCGSPDLGRPARTRNARASAPSSRPCRVSPRATASTIASQCCRPLAMADMIAGLSGAMATVIAVRNVEVNGGRGQVIDVSLLESIFSILGPEAAIYKLSRKVRKRVGSASEGTSPRNVYATSDGGWVAISASTQAMTERLFRAIGRDDLNQNPDFKTNTERVKRRPEVDAIVGEFIKQRTLAEAIDFFEKAEVTAAPVYDIGQFLGDPHVQERGIVVEAPDADMGECPCTPSCRG